MARILSYGSLNVDYVYQVPHFVRPGETLTSTIRKRTCGGKGLNQSIAVARAGGTVFQAGKVGYDGAFLVDMLRENGVDVSLLANSESPSGHAIIQVEPSGQNRILLYGGSNQEITRGEVDRVIENFGTGDYLILQNEINQLQYIMERAVEKGIFIVFNPSPISDVLWQLPLHTVSLLVFNEVEGTALAGCSNEEEIMDTLRTRWPDCRLLLTLGSRGCIYDDGAKRIRKGIYRTETVDTTAAGDTFTGYFVSCMADGRFSAEECLELASKAAAIAVSRQGAAQSIPTIAEVQSASFTPTE